MDAFTLYLLKSFIWITGFALIYILFLRNERFFLLNRIYLISGILVSFFFPLITVHYTIELPVIDINQTGINQTGVSQVENYVRSTLPESTQSFFPSIKLLILLLYLIGILFQTFRILRQTILVFRVVKMAEPNNVGPTRLIRTTEFPASFSFFNCIFVNHSITDAETEEIVNHELVHIRQMHWFDVMLAELLCIFQWFNPFVWIYVRLLRQNHEYLADKAALQRSSNPAIYKAALLNQIFSSPVLILTNSFNYSLNKKRFEMMKKINRSPYRKMKLLLVLPVFAIVLYSFAKPEIRYSSIGVNTRNQTTDSINVAKSHAQQPKLEVPTNWYIAGSKPNSYEMGIDKGKGQDGKNAATIKSIDQMIDGFRIDGFGTLMQDSKPDKFLGKRVRMIGFMKSENVTDWAGFWLRVDQAGSQQALAFDNMQDRAITGTTDWKKYEIVLDVPKNASRLAYGALLSGTGQIWFDRLTFEIVDKSVKTTGAKSGGQSKLSEPANLDFEK